MSAMGPLQVIFLLILISASAYLPCDGNFYRGKKCGVISHLLNKRQHCEQCNTRMPIRFGKRARQVDVLKIHSSSELLKSTNCKYLMQMLLRKTVTASSDNSFKLRLEY